MNVFCDQRPSSCCTFILNGNRNNIIVRSHIYDDAVKALLRPPQKLGLEPMLRFAVGFYLYKYVVSRCLFLCFAQAYDTSSMLSLRAVLHNIIRNRSHGEKESSPYNTKMHVRAVVPWKLYMAVVYIAPTYVPLTGLLGSWPALSSVFV